jgi:hypothetical protein
VWRDWAGQHAAYNELHLSPRAFLLGFVLAGLPTFALLGAALAGRGRLPPIAGWTVLIAAGLLAPFILVNHSVRHQGALLGLHAIALGVLVHCLVARWRERAARRA